MRTIRRSTPSDIRVMRLMFDFSKSIMRNNGNLHQWTGDYPNTEQLLEDMARQGSFIIEDHGTPVGTFAFFVGKDPTYGTIEYGDWIDDDAPYGTIHRLACAPDNHGIAHDCLCWCERKAPTLRADTHADNRIMQHILEREGFSFCGIIHINDGTARNAYQLVSPMHLCDSLVDWVESEVIPLYNAFDSAHREEHVRRVTEECLRLGRMFGLNANICFATAALHDIGLNMGREIHHLASGDYVRHCTPLRQWFSEKQIELIAEAVEDHRASLGRRPRSLFGCIVADADRDLDKVRIVRRTIQFGLTHYPDLSKEEHWVRSLNHLNVKYAEGGYLNLNLAESKCSLQLDELRRLIADRTGLRALFERLYAEEGGR